MAFTLGTGNVPDAFTEPAKVVRKSGGKRSPAKKPAAMRASVKKKTRVKKKKK